MDRYPIHLTRLVHENLSIVMSFAFSRKPLIELIEERSMGEWGYLEKALFEIGEDKANRAITELALLLRIHDDEERITNFDEQVGLIWSCGRLILEDGSVKDLPFREVSNKIIHAKTFRWDFSADEPPKLICYAREDDARRWIRAEVDLVAVAFYCGRFMS